MVIAKHLHSFESLTTQFNNAFEGNEVTTDLI